MSRLKDVWLVSGQWVVTREADLPAAGDPTCRFCRQPLPEERFTAGIRNHLSCWQDQGRGES
jgi:hypothetical protein